jgi:hypothetical protein
MTEYKDFEEMEVWGDSQDLAVQVYQMEDCRDLLPAKVALDICGNGYLG